MEYPTSKYCITILYHAIEYTVASTINATYSQASFWMALNWLPIVYDLDNVFKTLSKGLLIKFMLKFMTQYKGWMSNKIIIVKPHLKETGNSAAY